ncbi:MAG: GAF domain-containing protein, partial [Chloroflexi bacterium]|nr:GAF domain-containing protein [Chloroflexota bacterium]
TIGLGASGRGLGDPVHVYLTDDQGSPVWEWAKPDRPEVPSNVLTIRTEEMDSGRGVVMKAVRIRELPPASALVFSVPVAGPDGGVRGFVTAALAVNPSNSALFIPSDSESADYRLELVDTEGIVVASSDQQHVGQPSRHLSINGDVFREGGQGVWKHHSSSSSSDGGDHVVALVPLETVPWTVALEQDEDVALALPGSLRSQIFLLSAIGIVAGLILAGFTTRQVVRPLTRLTETAGRIASGDLRTPVPIEGQDEVRTLSCSFEAMRLRTEQTLNEVASLLKVAQAVEESPELDRVLPGVLKSVLDATAAEVAEVWLVDEREDVIILRHHEGEAEEGLHQTTRLRLGEGYPGMVVQNGEPIISRDLAGDDRFEGECIASGGYRTLYALPLRRAGKTIGVLATVARDSEAPGDQGELRLLELIADHIAIAVENARLHEEVQTLAILTERDRLAKEMHDGLGQVLGYVNTKAQAVKEMLKGGQVDEAIVQMGQLEVAAQETYDDVREAILALSAGGRKQRLLDSLSDYVDRFADLAGLRTELVVEGTPFQFNPAVEVQLLRIVQEGLANARKHAEASRARVLISFVDHGTRVVVEDDGRGFDPTRAVPGPWPHLGLRSMQERAAAIGATFSLDTVPGKGTRVIVELLESGG